MGIPLPGLSLLACLSCKEDTLPSTLQRGHLALHLPQQQLAKVNKSAPLALGKLGSGTLETPQLSSSFFAPAVELLKASSPESRPRQQDGMQGSYATGSLTPFTQSTNVPLPPPPPTEENLVLLLPPPWRHGTQGSHAAGSPSPAQSTYLSQLPLPN